MRQYPFSKKYASIRYDVVLKEIKPLGISRWGISCVYTSLSCFVFHVANSRPDTLVLFYQQNTF